MAKINWSNLALDDLRSIYDYVAKDSPIYADRLMNKIFERVEALEQHPKLGRKVPELDNEVIRKLIEGNYRIIYRLEQDDKIGIARIHHSSKLLRGL